MKSKFLYPFLFPIIFILCTSACFQNSFENTNSETVDKNNAGEIVENVHPKIALKFNSDNAMAFIEQQLSFGPRIPGSSGSIATQNFIHKEMESSGWLVEKQNFEYEGIPSTNIIAKSSQNPPEIIIGTHYDTRALSDNESSFAMQLTPVPGANDGASGTAVLLELGNLLEKSELDIWLVFFDSEDQGRLNGWDWSLGAQYFVDHLRSSPQEVIIIDMIGDDNLEIYKEINSDKILTKLIWEEAEELGFASVFIPEEKYSIFDDHFPFINKGIPASLIIDIDYPFWHTTEDTSSNVSQKSIDIIGNVLFSFIKNHYYVN